MGRVDKRLQELEKKQEELLSQLRGLDLEDKPPDQDENNLGQVRKLVLRELTDVKIRIRNLHRNRIREGTSIVALKSINLLHDRDKKCSKVELVGAAFAKDDVDPDDDSFNPEALELNLTRPEMRMYPKIPLPHSQPLWDRVARVGRRKERAGGRLTDWRGQFTGVEEEEDRLKKMQERESRQWNWNKMNGSFKAEDDYRSWEEVKGEGFCSLDSYPLIAKSSGKEKLSEAASSDLSQANYLKGPNADLPDIAELKKLFPPKKPSVAPVVSPPDEQNTQESSLNTEQVFTKIKSRVDPHLISRIQSILSQNIKIGAEARKPCEVDSGINDRLSKNQNSNSKIVMEASESGMEEQKMSRGLPHLPVASNMITVRAKLVSPSVPVPLMTSNSAARPEDLREKLRKRLVKN